MANAIREARAHSPNVSAIEAGDSLISTDAKRRGAVTEQNARKAELMADFLKVANPEAVSLGEVDLLAGPATAVQLLASRGMTPVMTNLRFADSSLKTVPFVAWEVAGYRFLFVNLFGPKAASGFEGVTVSDPMAALDQVVTAAGKVDVLVAACHRFDDGLLRRFAEKEGPPRIAIDVEGSSRLKSVSSTTRTMIVRPPARGTELLTMELYLQRDTKAWYRMSSYGDAVRENRPLEAEAETAVKCSLVEVKTRRLGPDVAGDPGLLKRIEEYKASTRRASLAAAPDLPDAPKYVGAESCGSCHEEQAANWKSTFHADAWESLVKDPDGATQDPECVSCHVSGFLQPGGSRSIEETVPFRGVQCESCHAPIAKHPGGGKYAKVNDALCRTCHSETRDPDFEYAKYLKYATCTKPHDRANNRVPR